MSDHFTFSFTTDLNIDISSEEAAIIDYMVGSNREAPNSLPKHSYFQHGLSGYPYGLQYRDYPKKSYSSESWVEKNSHGEIIRRAVKLYLPSQKLEGIYESCLPFASWLATVSSKSGYVGSFSGEDIEDFDPTLLFIYKRELYFGDSDEANSVSTGNTICFKTVG